MALSPALGGIARAEKALAQQPWDAGDRVSIGVDPGLVNRLVGIVAPDKFVGVVLFKSNVREGVSHDKFEIIKEEPGARHVRPVGPGRLVQIPATGYQSRQEQQEEFFVDGVFELVRSFAGKAPSVGQVKKSVVALPMYNIRPRHEPLRDLQKCYSAAPDTMRADNTFIVVASPEAKDVLDGAFLGPIAEEDIQYLEPLVKALLAGKGKAAEQEARGFLVDGNPLIAMLGLRRLEALRAATPREYASVIALVPRAYIGGIFLAGNSQAWAQPAAREQFPRELRTVFDKAEPDRRAAILGPLATFVQRNRSSDLAQGYVKQFPELEAPQPESTKSGG
jgi:hypothetical protein